MRRLLVTGGAGFIGANFVRHWLNRHLADRVVVLDALTYAGNMSNLGNLVDNVQFRFVRGEITDQALVETLLEHERLDIIVHFAAESHVDRSIVAPDAFLTTNVIGTYRLLCAARNVWLRGGVVTDHLFHHVSTDEVFGSLEPDDPPFCEDTRYAPNSPYSATKAASDHLVRAFHHTYGLTTTVSNCSNNYGPYQFPEKLIPLMIINSLQGRPLPVYGDGGNIRDWLHVADHCRGIELTMEQGQHGQTYNFGGRSEVANIDVVRMIAAEVDSLFLRDRSLVERFPQAPAARGEPTESLLTFVSDRPGHDRRYAIDCSRAENELGYRPRESLASGLAATVLWYVQNEAWWQEILRGEHRHWLERQYGADPANDTARV
jgi:dTDP-glucose 4,6-dehydratase